MKRSDAAAPPSVQLSQNEKTTDNFDRFMALLRRYVYDGIEELTPTMANEHVKKIIVHVADNSTGKRVRQAEIVFNYIGGLDFPAVNQPNCIQRLQRKNA